MVEAAVSSARLRRLTTLFRVFGVFLPIAPHVLGFPQNGSCFDIRLGETQCAFAGLVCLVVAVGMRRAVRESLNSTERRWTMPLTVAAILGWFLLPCVPMPYWIWSVWR